MSQLNNNDEKKEEKVVKEKTKRKLNTKTKIIIFLVIFAVISIACTCILIFINKNSKKDVAVIEEVPKKKEIIKIEDDGFGIKNLTERYTGNDLKLDFIDDGIGTREPTNEYDKNTNKIKIEYISIDGLKNESIEKKINQEIKDKAYEAYSKEELNNSNIDAIYINEYSDANYGNVLSVRITKSISYKKTGDKYTPGDYIEDYLNYDLTTGNKIKFEELFTNGTSIKNVLIPAINKSIRNKYMQEHQAGHEYETVDFSKMDLSAIEEETYKTLDKIIKNKDNLKFGFSCNSIFISFDDQNIEISMPTIYKNIAIYKRFLTEESIFDGSYSSETKNAFVFTYTYSLSEKDYKIYSRFENLADNFRIEVRVTCANKVYDEEEGKKLYNEYVDRIANNIQKLKNEAKNNQEQQILYVAEYTIWGRENKNLTDLGIKHLMVDTGGNSHIYRMSKKYYDEKFYEKMAEVRRDPFAGGSEIFFYDIEENNKDVSIEEEREAYQTFDLYTNKTENQLRATKEIDNLLTSLEEDLEKVKNGESYSQYRYLYYKSTINMIKSWYNLSEDEFKEEEQKAQEIADEISKILQQRTIEKKEAEEKRNAEIESQAKSNSETEAKDNNVDIKKAISYGGPLSEGKAYIKDGYLYYSSSEDEDAEKIEGVSNAKYVDIYNIGTGINKVPFVVTEDGIVYRLNAAKELVKYQELSDYKVDKIISHEGEAYDVFTLLLKDGTTKVVEVKGDI